GCNFIGFGVGWDNWKSKDLTSILDNAAVRLAVKAPEDKTIFGLTFICLMEDYSGNFIAGNFKSKYFQEPPIRDSWQYIYLPFNEFEESAEFELNNVKQMSFEFFGSSRIVIGDIEIVEFNDHKADPLPYKLKVEEKLPHNIFDQGFHENNYWGLIEDECRKAKILTEDGNQFISYSWESGKDFPCNDIKWGFSWSGWHPVDFANLPSSASLEFDIRSTDMPNIKIGVIDYNFGNHSVALSSYYPQNSKGSSWVRVKIPLKDLVSGDIQKDNIKQIVFIHSGKGKIDLDNIKLLNS
ncbi:MAG: hypothetical protein HKN92_00100, partial [Chitinophagales bacterium]|nr:hypothetical protein [Chitinophagales bacterium]